MTSSSESMAFTDEKVEDAPLHREHGLPAVIADVLNRDENSTGDVLN